MHYAPDDRGHERAAHRSQSRRRRGLVRRPYLRESCLKLDKNKHPPSANRINPKRKSNSVLNLAHTLARAVTGTVRFNDPRGFSVGSPARMKRSAEDAADAAGDGAAGAGAGGNSSNALPKYASNALGIAARKARVDGGSSAALELVGPGTALAMSLWALHLEACRSVPVGAEW